MNAQRIGDRDLHLAPPEVRRRMVRAIARSAREQAGLPSRPRDPRARFARWWRTWRKRQMPLF